MAFVVELVSPPRARRAAVTCCSRAGPERLADAGRRDVLAAVAFLPLWFVTPAAADRTGKFSTKLTAARRYIPRISAFRDKLGELKPDVDAGNFAAVAAFTAKDGPADDVKNPLELFASSFFSEGNKASSNSELKPTIDAILKANETMRKSAAKKDLPKLQQAYKDCVFNLNEYIEVVRSVKAFGNDLDPLVL